MTPITRPPLHYHGAKFRLAPWILRFFPPHRMYTEAYGGAAGVLLQKPRSHGEIYNDLDGEIVNFFRVLRDPQLAPKLVEQLALTPYARTEFDTSYQPTTDPVELARRTAVRAYMGFGSGGATKETTGFRANSASSGSTAEHGWATYPATLGPVIERLQGVMIECRPAIDVLQTHDAPDTLHFIDPPYLHSTRVMSSRVYRHEMTNSDHIDLLRVLRRLTGMIVLSERVHCPAGSRANTHSGWDARRGAQPIAAAIGKHRNAADRPNGYFRGPGWTVNTFSGYASQLYATQLSDWASHQTQANISGGHGGSQRTEVLWLNPACQAALGQANDDLFAGLM